MQVTKQGNNNPEYAGFGMVLGRCLVEGDPESTSRARRIRQKTFGVSLAIEILLLGLLVVAPLLGTVARPSFSRPAFGPFILTVSHLKSAVARPTTPIHQPSYDRHDFITDVTDHPPRPPVQPTEDAEDPRTQILDLLPAEPGHSAPPFVGLPPTGPAAPAEEIKRNQEKHPLKLSEPVVEAQLTSRIEPRYPPLALQMRLAGTVVLHAIISRDGHIDALEVVSGSPFFVQAALDAVREWRYRPTLLNGEPVEVETTITVVFQLRR
ncbi:MAG TPA: TonB family protein [Candidatus Acidoferrales bacterium]|jgi:protein TonB|nr:TonB family protein [Candidatus Acidoferrales bacterium]